MKKLTTLLLTLTLLFYACNTSANNNDNTDENDPEPNGQGAPLYESIDFSNARYFDHLGITFDTPVVIIRSQGELDAFDPDDLMQLKSIYTDDFFKDRALILAEFIHCSSDEYTALSGIIEKDGKLCPVVAATGSSDEFIADDILTGVICAEINAQDVGSSGNLLIRNTFEDRPLSHDYELLGGKLKEK